MNLDFNHQEIEEELAILCTDLHMMCLITNRLFDPVIPYKHPDKKRRFDLDQAADFYNGKTFDRKYGSQYDGL